MLETHSAQNKGIASNTEHHLRQTRRMDAWSVREGSTKMCAKISFGRREIGEYVLRRDRMVAMYVSSSLTRCLYLLSQASAHMENSESLVESDSKAKRSSKGSSVALSSGTGRKFSRFVDIAMRSQHFS